MFPKYDKIDRQHTFIRRCANVGIVACIALAATLGLSSCVSANASPAEAGPSISFAYVNADSARAIAKWSPACDGKGCADAYQVRWTAINASRVVTKSQTADTFYVARPAFGDSLMVSVTINAVRRGVPGAPRTASAWLRTPDSAPPPVDSIVIDTLPSHVDSMRLEVISSSGVELATPLISEGDSVMLRARFYITAGYTRQPRDTVNEWVVIASTPGAIARVSSRWADSAWVVAESCGCVESGQRESPPQFDLRSGEYVVRDRDGRLRPVTTLGSSSADPFRQPAARRSATSG